MENRNQKMIDALKTLVAFLEERPTMKFTDSEQTFYVSCTPDELKKAVAQLGETKKSSDATWFNVDKRINGLLRLHYYTGRESICERVKTGTKVIPATEEKYIPGRVEPAKPEQVIDVYEWKCPDSLLRDPADVLSNSVAEAIAESNGEPPTVQLTEEQIQAAENAQADIDAEAAYKDMTPTDDANNNW